MTESPPVEGLADGTTEPISSCGWPLPCWGSRHRQWPPNIASPAAAPMPATAARSRQRRRRAGWLMCITELAKEGGHDSCSVDRKAASPCPGIHKVLVCSRREPHLFPPVPAQAAIPEPPAAPPRSTPPSDQPVNCRAGTKRVPQTMEELAGDTYEASKEGLKKAGDSVTNTAKKAGDAVAGTAKTAGERSARRGAPSATRPRRRGIASRLSSRPARPFAWVLSGPAATRAPDAVPRRSRPGTFRSKSRADIVLASSLPRIAARLNHLCACTKSSSTSRPEQYIRPKLEQGVRCATLGRTLDDFTRCEIQPRHHITPPNTIRFFFCRAGLMLRCCLPCRIAARHGC